MSTMNTYFPGAPPGADPFHGFEAALATKIAALVPGYPFGYYAPIPAAETQPDPPVRVHFISRIRRPHSL